MDDKEKIKELEKTIVKLEEELEKTKEHLKKYTAPKRNKKFYENHKEEIIKILNSSLELLKKEKYQNHKKINLENINLILKTCENLDKYHLNTRLSIENLALNLIPIMI